MKEVRMNAPATPLRKLPIEIHSFEKLRSEGYLYVDKTAIIYPLVTRGKAYFFGSRPHGFGKSLLLSTLEAYFKGKKELFEGLAIEQWEVDWLEYPVLHLDWSGRKYNSYEDLEKVMEPQLEKWEAQYGVEKGAMTYSGRLLAIIRQAYHHTGRRAVVLVDEYDAPVLQSFDNFDLQEKFCKTLTAFYAMLKTADPYLQFVFVTGATKFAFSSMNHLNDISLHRRENLLCGFTRQEIETVFAPEWQAWAAKMNVTRDELMEQLAFRYGGYRFTYEEKSIPVYNPFSVLHALDEQRLGDYWFASQSHAFLLEALRTKSFDFHRLQSIQVPAASLTDYTASLQHPFPIFYQKGYVTIKEYDSRFELYTLGVPNEEVFTSLSAT